MARGWGKDEDHREEATAAKPQDSRPQELRRADQERQRRIQILEQQRERILSERTASPHRRAALQAALVQVEAELQSSKCSDSES